MRTLLLALLLVAPSFADNTPPSKKGKTGDACKTNADCDQSSNPQICKAGKCQVNLPPPPTYADATPPKDGGKGGGKAKAGGACKADADCDQSGRPQSCRDGKCQAAPPPHPVT